MIRYQLSAKKIRGVVMKKHKMEIAALSLLLVVLCYAFYDSNIKGSEQTIVLSNELFSTKEIKSKEDFTMEMLSLPSEDEKEEKEVKEEVEHKEEVKPKKKKNTVKKVKDGKNVYSINLAAVDKDIPYNEIISNQVINYALKFVGRPYVYGGNSLTNGTDCSGFTKLIFKKYGINLPRGSRDQAYVGKRVGLKNIMPGDLVFSGYNGRVGHVAIYIGNNKLVHALNSKVGIVVTDLYIMPILDVRRVI